MTTSQGYILRRLATTACSDERKGEAGDETECARGTRAVGSGELRLCALLVVAIVVVMGLYIFNSVDQGIKNRYFEVALRKLNASLCGNRQRRNCDDDYDNYNHTESSDGEAGI